MAGPITYFNQKRTPSGARVSTGTGFRTKRRQEYAAGVVTGRRAGTAYRKQPYGGKPNLNGLGGSPSFRAGVQRGFMHKTQTGPGDSTYVTGRGHPLTMSTRKTQSFSSRRGGFVKGRGGSYGRPNTPTGSRTYTIRNTTVEQQKPFGNKDNTSAMHTQRIGYANVSGVRRPGVNRTVPGTYLGQPGSRTPLRGAYTRGVLEGRAARRGDMTSSEYRVYRSVDPKTRGPIYKRGPDTNVTVARPMQPGRRTGGAQSESKLQYAARVAGYQRGLGSRAGGSGVNIGNFKTRKGMYVKIGGIFMGSSSKGGKGRR